MDISFVIPVYNEESDLRQLHSEITEVMSGLARPYEIIFINDGSTDGSWSLIKELRAQDGRVRGVSFRRNFGKSEALAAGFARAEGKFIFTLDADLQDNPKEIPAFLEKMEEGFDLVSGWKKLRHDPLEKRLPSKLFNAVVSYFCGVKLHDFNCGFKCYRAECAKEIDVYGERHRFMPALAFERGFKVGELVVEHRARIHGHSKFGFERYARGFLDLLTVWFLGNYTRRPAHLLGGLGVLFGLAGFIFLLISFIFLGTSRHFGGSLYCLISGCTLLVISSLGVLFGLTSELIVARSRTPKKTIHSVGEEF